MTATPLMDTHKIDDLCSLFLHCNHQEQLELLRRLPDLICRDFIGQSPVLVLVLILKYLLISDVINCLRVCHMWYDIIRNCNNYWRWVCHKAGLVLNDHTHLCGLYMDLGLKAERHVLEMRHTLSNYKLHTDITNTHMKGMRSSVYEDCHGSVVVSVTRLLFPQYHTVFIHSGPSNKTILTTELNGGLHRPVVWAFLNDANNCIVFATDSADWGEIHYPSGKALYWVDSKIISPYTKLSACKTCSLIVQFEEQQPCSRTPLSWLIELFKLDHDSNSVQRVIRHILMEDVSISENDYVSVQSVALISKCSESIHEVCNKHHILVQLGGGVAVFSITYHSELAVVTCINMFSPGNSVNCLNSLGNKFRLSQDGTHLAFIQLTRLYVWDIVQTTLISVTDLKLHYLLLAVGNLYTILQSDNLHSSTNHFLITCTVTGKVLFTSSLHIRQTFCAPIAQDWLNSLNRFGDCIIFPCQTSQLLCGKIF